MEINSSRDHEFWQSTAARLSELRGIWALVQIARCAFVSRTLPLRDIFVRLLASFQDPCEEDPDCTLRLTDLLDEGLCELIGSLDDKTMKAAAMQMEADFPEPAAAFKTVTRMMI